VQASPVVEVVDLDLALLGQLEVQHVRRQVELGLGLVEVLLVEGVTGDPGRVHSQHDERVVLDAAGADVVAHLFTVPCVVLVLQRERLDDKTKSKEIVSSICSWTFPLTSLMISLEALAFSTAIASSLMW